MKSIKAPSFKFNGTNKDQVYLYVLQQLRDLGDMKDTLYIVYVMNIVILVLVILIIIFYASIHAYIYFREHYYCSRTDGYPDLMPKGVHVLPNYPPSQQYQQSRIPSPTQGFMDTGAMSYQPLMSQNYPLPTCYNHSSYPHTSPTPSSYPHTSPTQSTLTRGPITDFIGSPQHTVMYKTSGGVVMVMPDRDINQP